MKKLFYYFIIGLVTTTSIGVLMLPKKTEAACVVNSATFTPNGLQSIGDNSGGVSGEQWYTDSKQPKVLITIKTSGCAGKTLEVSITEIDYTYGNDVIGFDNKQFLVPVSEKINILTRAGEDNCGQDANTTGYSEDNSDCHYRVQISGSGVSSFESSGASGNLYYDCDGSCQNDWQYLTSSGEDIDVSSINAPVTVSGQQNFLNTGSYSLLAPIGSLRNISGNESVSTFLSSLFVMIVGLAGVFAVGSLIVAGFQYMLSDIVTKKSDAKDRIKNSLLGLLLVLGAYTILNTLNPDLVNNLGLSIETQTIVAKDIQFITGSEFTQLTGQTILSPTEYDKMAKTVATSVGIPYCAMKVILERESKGNPGAIGPDENVMSPDIPSRVAFINSGKKYDGTTFISDKKLITDKSVKNQVNVTNTDTLGLDWRFSKGLGLTQITLFPPGYFSSGYKENPPNITQKNQLITRNGFTPKQLLDPQNNLTVGASLWKTYYNQCNQDIKKTWTAYASGGCTSSNKFATKEAELRTQYYNQCIQSNPK